MVYGIIGMINFAHGEIFMIGSFIAVITVVALNAIGLPSVALSILLAFAFSIAVTSAYGWAVERIAYRPLQSSSRIAPLISAIGVSVFLQNFVRLAQGARVKPLQPMIEGHVTLMQDAGGFAVSLSTLQMIIMALTFALMLGLTFLIQKTSLGRA